MRLFDFDTLCDAMRLSSYSCCSCHFLFRVCSSHLISSDDALRLAFKLPPVEFSCVSRPLRDQHLLLLLLLLLVSDGRVVVLVVCRLNTILFHPLLLLLHHSNSNKKKKKKKRWKSALLVMAQWTQYGTPRQRQGKGL